MFFILFVLFFHSADLKANEACDLAKRIALEVLGPKKLIMFSDLMMKWAETDKHSFSEACEPFNLETGKILSAPSNKEKTSLNIYMRDLPQQTVGGAPLKLFFEKAKDKIKKRIASEREKIKNVKNCLEKNSTNKCLPVKGNTKAMLGYSGEYNFNDLIADARFNLLLSYPPSAFYKMTEDVSILNRFGKNYGIYKYTSWEPFTDEEKRDAKQALDFYFSTGKEFAKKKLNSKSYSEFELEKLAKDSVKETRYRHFAAYTAILAEYPILQFIKNLNPSKKEVIAATDGMLKSLKEEEKWLDEITESLDSRILDKDLLKILNYRSEVLEVLAENDEYCGIARDFKQLYDAKGLGFDVSVMAPVMAASFFVPVSTAAILGIGSGGALSIHEQIKMKESRYQVLGRFNPNSEDQLNTLSENYQNRNFELFFTALAAPGVKLSTKMPGLKSKLSRKPSP